MSSPSPSERLRALGVLATKPSPKKRHILTGDDNRRRTEEIATFLRDTITTHAPKFIAAESFVYHRGIKASAKMGLAWGALITTALRHDLPLLEASPQQVKVALARNKTATKEDMGLAARSRFGAHRVDELLDGIPAGLHEHAFDALGALVACLSDPVARLARSQAHGPFHVLALDPGFASLGWAVVELFPAA